jgi:cell division protease FtsH
VDRRAKVELFEHIRREYEHGGQAGGNKALSFGKSRARLLTAQQKKATFKDVAGIDEAKEELQALFYRASDAANYFQLSVA